MENVITALEPQKNNPDRINVFIDNQFAFGISRFVGAWLKKGEKLEKSRINELLKQDDHEEVLQKALKFIGYRPRSQQEVRCKLEQSAYNGEVIEDVINELGEKNYLNDERFAQEWIESRSNSKPRSRKYYSIELKRKGISEASIQQALEKAPSDNELALALGSKYLYRYAHLEDEEFKQKMHGVLARRAFSYEIIKETIKHLIAKRNLEK